MKLPRLAKLGGCYSPYLTKGRFRVREKFIRIYQHENRHVRSRLVACTPKAWKIIKNDKDILRKLRGNIGAHNDGRINKATIIALNNKGIYIDFLSRSNKGLFALCLMEEKDSEIFLDCFKELEEPTNRNLRIFEKTSTLKLNFQDLTVRQRKQLLGFLADQKVKLEQIQQVLLVDGAEIEILPSINGKLTIAFGRNCLYADTGFINWVPQEYKPILF
ncbi:MAG: hypothetical protein U9R38_03160 [Candidatus Margulisiibacteriota bacterium]|nr:hypothetical protein [Candidatus Margulisiibacteriota bacterium]